MMGKHDIYEAFLILNEKRIQKTFFPAHWPREKVVRAIFQAYENFVKKGGIPKWQPNGVYQIMGKTEEGITIKMVITPRGKIITAYPILER